MRTAFITAIEQLATAGEEVVLVTGDLGFAVFDRFAQKFPNQYLNVGVAEQNMVGVATGLAKEGYTVFTYSIGNFPTLRAIEQLRNSPCYHDLPVITVSVGGGFSYGQLGFSHHATEEAAIMRALPNMTVAVPGAIEEAAAATHWFAKRKKPAYLRIDKSSVNEFPGYEAADYRTLDVSRPRLIAQGSDVLLLAMGGVLKCAMEARQLLAAEGISASVASANTLSFTDFSLVDQALANGSAVITVEEHNRSGGLGTVVAEYLADQGHHGRRTPFYRLGLTGVPFKQAGSQDYLRALAGIDRDGIAATVRRVLAGTGKR